MTSAKDGKSSGRISDRSTTEDVSPRKGDSTATAPQNTKRPEIILGILTLIGVIITGLLGFPPIIEYFQRIVTTPTVIPSPTVFLSPTSLPSATVEEITPSPSPVPTSETPTVLPAPVVGKMIVSLQANMTSGKAPLLVNFDACNSYLQSDDGSIWPCSQERLCRYTWTVHQNGKQIGKPVQDQGRFSYKFTEKGTYFVTVYVCRGDVCDGNGIAVEVR